MLGGVAFHPGRAVIEWCGHQYDEKPDQGVYRHHHGGHRRLGVLRRPIVFAILIIVLLVKPSGIMGKNKGEKV